MDNLRGITLMVVAMAAFAVEDAFIKLAARDLPTGQILIVIGLAGGAVFATMARRAGIRLITPALWRGPILIRNAAEIVGTIGFVTAITTIPLSTASAIAQAMPLVITMGAALIFAEPVGWRRWTAILVGLSGVLIIIRPGLDVFDPNALWAVLAVFALAARDLAARAVPASVSHLQLAAYGFASLVPTGLILLPFAAVPPALPDARLAGLLCGAVLFGMLAYYAITFASRTGDVSVVTPFRFSRMLFALIIGMTVFGERPDMLTYLGATLIIATGGYTFLRERRLGRMRRPAPAAPGPVPPGT
ncbi:Permease of the drug/metabolite transporter (DMT) superfamily [Roseivivax lentus]|uniref:Permease of the drug/metabolite transporter (DMT) superfamily n=1 Tax=Roseivivax lentus TaxID=633194 RepID=A0A1N7N6D2_9RHOB|nr:DMT family transporter [Roseivivax lentus]SIS93890.1 Permease of the drug/metabolite transporter (DMT) superfamily [Roseivivax lentus]